MSVMRFLLFLGPLILAAPAMLVPGLTMLTAAAQQPVVAQPGASAAVAPVSALYGALTAIEARGGPASFDQRVELLAPAIDRAFNLPTVLQTSVGLRYRSLPDAQKAQLEQVFRQFTIARYVSNFAPDSGETLKVDPSARPSAYGSDQIVQTQIVSPSGSVTRVDYVMRSFPQGWQAVDVLLDGHISQVAVQRSDFASTVSTGDATPLIESLRKKIQSFSGS